MRQLTRTLMVLALAAGVLCANVAIVQHRGGPPPPRPIHRGTYVFIGERIYLSPAATFKLELAMAPLRPGETSEPPSLAPAPAPPPDGSFTSPRTPPRGVIPPPEAPPAFATIGTLSLRVQPANAVVTIDGEHFIVQLVAGPHRVDVTEAGYQPLTADIQMRDDGAIPLNVSLIRQRP